MGNVSPRHSKSFHDGLNHHLALSSATTSSATPSRSSWKKQLQILNETLNIKKFSRRHPQGKTKRSKTISEEKFHSVLATSRTTQNFNEFFKENSEKIHRDDSTKELTPKSDDYSMNFKKSFSLFSIKQTLNYSSNSKPMNNTTNLIVEKVEEQSEAVASVPAPAPATATTSVNSISKHSQRTMPSKENQPAEKQRRSKCEITTTASNGFVNKRHSAFVLPSYHLSKSQSQYYHPHQHQQQQKNQLSSNGKFSSGFSSSTKTISNIDKSTTRKTIIQASTSELLRCLGEYLCSSCSHLLPILDPIDCILWIKSADRQLVLQGWQEQVFVNPANIVFVYLLVRETLTHVVPSPTIKSVTELHAIILTCLYLAFSYMGNEITYPLKPFVTENEAREVFWQRVVLLMGQLSSKMLAINQNPKFFTECFSELKTYNLVR